MPRSNERCFEYTPKELGLQGRVVPPCSSMVSTIIDLPGAKIFCVWIKATGPLIVHWEYLDAEASDTKPVPVDQILQTVVDPEVIVIPNQYVRFQFALYGHLQLPAIKLRIRFQNDTDQKVSVTAHGVSQIQ